MDQSSWRGIPLPGLDSVAGGQRLPMEETPRACALSDSIDRPVDSAVDGCTGHPEVADIPIGPRIFLVLLVLIMAACSRTQLLYDKADWLAYRWTANLVDASGAQKQAWRELFREAMAQHRRDLLSPTVGLLGELEAILQRGPTQTDLSCLIDATGRLQVDHVRWAAPTAVAVLTDLTPLQVDHLGVELAERNDEYADDYLDADPKRRSEARVQRYVERIERWTGDLDAKQVRLVEQSLQDLPDLAGDWLAYRRDRQARLLELLRSGVEPAELRGFITGWWADFSGRTPALVQDAGRLQEGTLHMVLKLEGELSDLQRAELLESVAQLRSGLAAASGESIVQWPDAACAASGSGSSPVAH